MIGKYSAFVFILPFLWAGGPEESNPFSDRVDQVFAAYDKTDSPGCALGVIRDGELIYRRGYGLANLEYDLPIDSRSVFRVGSVSKQFTAVATALLAEEGKISLDADIRRYIPELPRYQKPVTVRHLIHHTSGIRDYLALMSLAGAREDDFYTSEEVIDLLSRQKELNFQPGARFLYSNSNYFLLSVIVERRSGKSLAAYARSRIFEPLGMKNTHYQEDHRRLVPRRASGYRRKPNGSYETSMTSLEMIGDGGVFTTIDDLLLWDRNFYENKLGGGDLLSTLQTRGVLDNGKKLEYAFGLTVGQYKGLRTVRHSGAFVGFRAELLRFPEERFSVACLCNLAQTNPSRLAEQVAEVYLSDRMSSATSEIKPGIVTARGGVSIADSQLLAAVGAYQDHQGRIWQLRLDMERLYLTFLSGRRYRLAPIRYDRLRTVNSPTPITIEIIESWEGRGRFLKVWSDEQEPTLFKEVELVSPSDDQLLEYEGLYFSPELRATYRVHSDGGKLHVRHANPRKPLWDRPLRPTVSDRFYVLGSSLRFRRTPEGRIEGFELDSRRVRNLRFEKQDRVETIAETTSSHSQP